MLQLCFYTEQVARIQGRMPEAMHVVTGLGERETFRPEDYTPTTAASRRFLDAVANAAPPTLPGRALRALRLPRALQGAVGARRPPDARRRHLAAPGRAAHAGGITHAGGARARAAGHAVRSMRPATLETLRHQAELQLHRRETGEHRVDLLPVEDERGFTLLPEPSPGDIWLDLEGHPVVRAGARARVPVRLGRARRRTASRATTLLWAHDRAGEKAAFERLVDLIVERRRRFPGMHVYHYAPTSAPRSRA